MAGINKAILVGRLGRDPEIRHTTDGRAVCNFSIATSEEWKDKESGDRKERTEWHRVVAFGRLGEICGEYLSKGKQVYLEGRIQTREWEDKEGNKKYTTEIIANQMQMLGAKDSSSGGKGSGSSSGMDSSEPSYPDSEPRDEDIPF
ncbi:MAG: single-stranded DNA-binding protein [Desulfobacterales bacterium]|nr:single-stranded DNA-binding protein [Desulfobacterales bacterium]